MIPLRLRVHAYKTFDDLELDLPDGLVAILGEVRDVDGVDSNGAGKSSLLEAVEVALFGRRSLQPYHQRGAVDDLEVELEFAHAGGHYRCRRSYNPRGRGKTTFDLERLTAADGWQPLTLESAKATQERLERTIGFSQTTWRNSFYLRQGDGSFADPTLDPRHRRQLLSDALALDVWDGLRERARADLRTAEQRLHELDGRVQAARELAATKADVLVAHAEAHAGELDHADTLADREREHLELGQRWQQAREQAARRQAAEADLAAARAQLQQVQILDDAATEAALATTMTTDELDTLATDGSLAELVGREAMLVALAESHRLAVAEHKTLARDAQEASIWQAEHLNKIAALNARSASARGLAGEALANVGEAHCELCKQVLGAQAAEQYARNQHAQADAWDAEVAELQSQVAAIVIPDVPAAPAPPSLEGDTAANHLVRTRHAIESTRRDLAQRARLEERLVSLQVTVDARPAQPQLADALRVCDEKLHALEALGETVSIAALEQQGLAAKHAVDQAKIAFDTARTARTRLEERLAQITAAEEQIAAAEAERATVEQELELAAALECAYGPSGIPTLVLENTAIPAIETDANRCLALLGCPYAIELRTQAQRKSGDGVRDTLDVVIVDQHGDEAPFEECTSGGEKTRIGVALRVGLGLLLDRRGAGSGLLALDEPGWLDEAGMGALLGFLETLQAVFPKIYVISHVPTLRDSFDEVLTVVKGDDGVSRVDEQAVFEPVPA